MKDNKDKIEFWLHENQKAALKKLSQDTGYTLSELMRRGAEYVIKELSPAAQAYPDKSQNNTKPEV